jgi:hypothetical protein
LYRDTIQTIATKRGLYLADLFGNLISSKQPLHGLTDNGLHLTEVGYKETTKAFLAALGLPTDGAYSDSMNNVRTAIVAKNELYFHRWRPQNQTYLFGFRKHEQGRNAKEIVEFDPLIATAEATIQELLSAGR